MLSALPSTATPAVPQNGGSASRASSEPGADKDSDSFARALGDAAQPAAKPAPRAAGPSEEPSTTPNATTRTDHRTDAKAETRATANDRARNSARAAQTLDAARERRAVDAAQLRSPKGAEGAGDSPIDADSQAPDDPVLPTDKAQVPAEGLGALLAQLRSARAALPGGPESAAQGAFKEGAAQAAASSPQRPGLSAHGLPGSDMGRSASADAADAAARAAGPAASASLAAEASQAQATQADFGRQLAVASGEAAGKERAPADEAALRLEALPLPAAAAQSQTERAAVASAEVQLPASPGSAEFGSQFSTQVTTFVRDGIEHARLHLNPAEMGPVSVQIQLDGATALVHLSADHAETRQALEQAMPELASSLREAGLTLTGGGVFEQPRQGNDAGNRAGDGTGRNRSGEPGDARDGRDPRNTPVERTASPARRRGVVDLVA